VHLAQKACKSLRPSMEFHVLSVLVCLFLFDGITGARNILQDCQTLGKEKQDVEEQAENFRQNLPGKNVNKSDVINQRAA